MHRTCLDHVVHGRKPFVHRCAHRAEDEQGGQIDVAHQRPSEQAPVLVAPVDTAGDEEHEPVRPREIHKLVPPSIHYQSNIEPCGRTRSHHGVSHRRHLNGHTFSRILAFLGVRDLEGWYHPNLTVLPSKRGGNVGAWQGQGTQ